MRLYEEAQDDYSSATAQLQTATENGKLMFQARQADQKAMQEAKQQEIESQRREKTFGLQSANQARGQKMDLANLGLKREDQAMQRQQFAQQSRLTEQKIQAGEIELQGAMDEATAKKAQQY